MFLIAYVGTALIVTIVVVSIAAYLAKRQGKNPYKWAGLSFLGLFVLVFWDYYPTKWAHQYYCEKEAGFWIYKTLEQWKAENPGVVDTLIAKRVSPSLHETFNYGYGETNTYLLNDRFNWVVTKQDILWFFLPIIRVEQQVKDIKKNEVLARYIDFGSGNSVKNTSGSPGPLKFWLHSGNCSGGEINRSKLIHFADDAENISTQGESPRRAQ